MFSSLSKFGLQYFYTYHALSFINFRLICINYMTASCDKGPLDIFKKCLSWPPTASVTRLLARIKLFDTCYFKNIVLGCHVQKKIKLWEISDLLRDRGFIGHLCEIFRMSEGTFSHDAGHIWANDLNVDRSPIACNSLTDHY